MTRPPVPTRLREFVKDVLLEEDDEHVCVTVKLRCPRCGGTKFVLYWQHLREAGRDIETSPVWIACHACRYYALLFDSNCEGANGMADEGPVRIPDCKVKAYDGAGLAGYAVDVFVQFDSHDDPAAPDWKEQLNADEFDWFSILVEQPDGSMDGAIDFETA